MDMLKRSMAPLAASAWKEIDARAEEVLKSRLTARKAVKVNGPLGWDYTSVSEGRLDLIEDVNAQVKTGIFRIKPLVESRISFTLNRWELDNLTRGAKDINLENLEEAVKKMADFEENAVYKGFESGGIVGLEGASAHAAIEFGKTGADIMDSISKGLITLKDNFEEGPFILVVGEEAYKRLNREVQGYPLVKRIESLIGGKILLSGVVDGAFLLPYDNENLELTIGQDFAIGYESYDSEEVKLFIAESLTFRVLDENIVVRFTV
ncbi:family 1 encapsulin nanocompartment shell protein [Alkalibacter mobilis]|uniref:family 1 encapsulin nanocompartment shell protein n=1 Tax=Alkalibacter mobilis TaxID=2787712 RepID=UPI00189E6129|nr:family 1 encapsulin nanocompartment shell protein [Alkalibacter mobilis]MBF7097637.1 bacteriocin family protein [Alkalibacter mobilis]